MKWFLVLLLVCVFAIAQDVTDVTTEVKANNGRKYAPVLSPYHGQYWECVCSRDFYIKVDTIQVKHVWRDRLVPMEGPDVRCDRMRRVR